MSRTFNMVGGGGGKAALDITVTNGTATSVTATKDGSSVSLIQTGGTWFAVLPSFGAWIVTITDGTHTNSATVNASTAGIYTATIYMPDVPSAYTQLEWIQGVSVASSGNIKTTIDTGIKPISNNRISGKYKIQFGGGKNSDVFVAYREPSLLIIGFNVSNVDNVYFYYSGTSWRSVNWSPVDENEHSYDARSSTIIVDGVSHRISSQSPVTTNTNTNLELVLATDLVTVRHKKFAVMNTADTAFIANLFPVIRNSDNAIGMYDVVRNTLYIPNNTVIAGPAV